MTDLLALLFLIFSFVSVTFPCGVLDQVWYLIVLASDLCLLSYFNNLLRVLKADKLRYINFVGYRGRSITIKKGN